MPRVARSIVALAFLCVLCCERVQAQEKVTFLASEPVERAPVLLRGELYRPATAGTHPAVILMHGCGGLQPPVRYALRGYAEALRSRGFAALILDSFGPRYYDGNEMCSSNAKLRDALWYRVADAFDALRYLRGLDFIDRDSVFLMGQSNGGSVALRAALAGTQRTYLKQETDAGFRGVIAFYPWCGLFMGRADISVPVLVLSGGRDDWVSARECQEVRAQGAAYEVRVYPNARHSFDLDVLTQKYAGFTIGRDPDAATDSTRRMFAFMNRELAENHRTALRASGSSR